MRREVQNQKTSSIRSAEHSADVFERLDHSIDQAADGIEQDLKELGQEIYADPKAALRDEEAMLDRSALYVLIVYLLTL